MTSTFTSVLKKIGTVLLDGSQIAAEVLGFPFIAQLIGVASPKVAAAVQTGVADLNTLAGFVSTAEAMFPGRSRPTNRLAEAGRRHADGSANALKLGAEFLARAQQRCSPKQREKLLAAWRTP